MTAPRIKKNSIFSKTPAHTSLEFDELDLIELEDIEEHINSEEIEEIITPKNTARPSEKITLINQQVTSEYWDCLQDEITVRHSRAEDFEEEFPQDTDELSPLVNSPRHPASSVLNIAKTMNIDLKKAASSKEDAIKSARGDYKLLDQAPQSRTRRLENSRRLTLWNVQPLKPELTESELQKIAEQKVNEATPAPARIALGGCTE